MLKPHMILADPETSTQTIAETVRFDILADSPDPNQVFELVNNKRLASGSPAFVADAKLAAIALARAKDMAERHYFAHKNPDGKYYYDLARDVRLNTGNSCENSSATFVTEDALFLDQWSGSLNDSSSCLMNPDFRQAGYAAVKMMLQGYDGKQFPAYLVVGIHASADTN